MRFGRLKLFRASEKPIRIMVNNKLTNIKMKVGEVGECFFVEEAVLSLDDAKMIIDPELNTSPIASPPSSPTTTTTTTIMDDADAQTQLDQQHSAGFRIRRSPSPPLAHMTHMHHIQTHSLLSEALNNEKKNEPSEKKKKKKKKPQQQQPASAMVEREPVHAAINNNATMAAAQANQGSNWSWMWGQFPRWSSLFSFRRSSMPDPTISSASNSHNTSNNNNTSTEHLKVRSNDFIEQQLLETLAEDYNYDAPNNTMYIKPMAIKPLAINVNRNNSNKSTSPEHVSPISPKTIFTFEKNQDAAPQQQQATAAATDPIIGHDTFNNATVVQDKHNSAQLISLKSLMKKSDSFDNTEFSLDASEDNDEEEEVDENEEEDMYETILTNAGTTGMMAIPVKVSHSTSNTTNSSSNHTSMIHAIYDRQSKDDFVLLDEEEQKLKKQSPPSTNNYLDIAPTMSTSLPTPQGSWMEKHKQQQQQQQPPVSSSPSMWQRWFGRKSSDDATLTTNTTTTTNSTPPPATPTPLQVKTPPQQQHQSHHTYKKSLRPSSEQLASMNLQYGKNEIKFVVSSRIQGMQEVSANIYLWKHDAKIVISDVDGTITRYGTVL